MNKQRAKKPFMFAVALLSAFSLLAASCSSDDGEATKTTNADGEEVKEINVAIVDNGAMDSIEKLTPKFTEETGITVNYSFFEEQNLREIVTRDVSSESDQFDVVMIGPYEAPQFGTAGLLTDLSAEEFAGGDEDYNLDDLVDPVREALSADGKLYAAPFYAESSFVMYREDLLEAAGQEMPDAPTWDEVAAIARAVDSEDVAGICLRGKPGWGDLGASFTTVLNTFGGTWWEANADGSIGEAQVDQPEFKEALEFYVDLVQDAGQNDAANASFPECRTLYEEGKVAMWYDATVAAGFLEADDSPVAGKNGFAQAPVKATDSSGWLWSWALAIPEANENKEIAWEYVSWVTSSEYIELAATELEGGWAAAPPGTRKSLYENEEYLAAAETFAARTLESISSADPDNPGTTPRPGVGGVQFVSVPEFQAVATRCTEEFSEVIADSKDIDEALANCQEIASEATVEQ